MENSWNVSMLNYLYTTFTTAMADQSASHGREERLKATINPKYREI